MENKYAPVNDYDYKMIEAYIDKPEVTQWYVNAFKKFSINGVDVMRWHWSWWAFFGSVFFLLYRKAYTAAAVLVVLLMVAWFIPFGWLILWTLTGGYATFYVYKDYKQKRLEVQARIQDEEKCFETMHVLGGTNEWAIIVGIIAQLFFWSTGVFMLGMILTVLSFLGLAMGNAG